MFADRPYDGFSVVSTVLKCIGRVFLNIPAWAISEVYSVHARLAAPSHLYLFIYA